MNVLAAIQRVKPSEILIITTEQNKSINAKNIRLASGLSELDVNIESLTDAYNEESVRDEVIAISNRYPSKKDDYILISGSTNPIAYMCYMKWPGKTISITRGLISIVDGEEMKHEITDIEFLDLYGLEEQDGIFSNLENEKRKLFRKSLGYDINKHRGQVVIYWNISPSDNFRNVSNHIRTEIEKNAEYYGNRTFFHKICTHERFRLHKEIEHMVEFELVEEEE
ncbi:MAG TPA: hypothetical protein D7I06_03090 [Candidatus Poseidoniales archaeon]|nr:MAG TPA: hypothetical protein D7I06_03090 [Candidatus Poseidoniales archaeon]